MRFKFNVSHAVAKMLQLWATGKGRKESENGREKEREREKEGAPAQVSDWLSSAGKRATGVGRQNTDRRTVGQWNLQGRRGNWDWDCDNCKLKCSRFKLFAHHQQ